MRSTGLRFLFHIIEQAFRHGCCRSEDAESSLHKTAPVYVTRNTKRQTCSAWLHVLLAHRRQSVAGVVVRARTRTGMGRRCEFHAGRMSMTDGAESRQEGIESSEVTDWLARDIDQMFLRRPPCLHHFI